MTRFDVVLRAGLCSAGIALALLAARNPAARAETRVLTEVHPATLTRGPADAAHRLVIYSDYECAACALLDREAGAALRDLAGEDRIRLEVRHFPLAPHRRAPRAAAVAVCAARQNAEWAMHEALFASAPRWRAGAPSGPVFLRLADSLGLDTAALAACISEPLVADLIAADAGLGRSVGLIGVPAVFLDGRPVRVRTPRGLVRTVRRAARGGVAGSPP